MRQLLPSIILALFIAGTMHAQMQFEGFEQWEERSGREQPVGWSIGAGSGKAPAGHGGDHALSVWTWYCSSRGGAVLGYVGNGGGAYLCEDFDFGCYGNYGIPIAFKPVSLSGYYRYLPGEAVPGTTDLAVVRILLKKHNVATGKYDTIGLAEHRLPPAETYVPFTVAVEDRAPGVMPDSIAIAFISGQTGGCDCAKAGSCFFFSVDDIKLDMPSGVSRPIDELLREMHIYPNPARGSVRVDWGESLREAHRLRFYSMSGEMVREIADITGSGTLIDRAGLPFGRYLLELVDDAGDVSVCSLLVIE